jgi:hypothetical protein
MTTITTAHVSSAAPPAAFFDRWADMTTWPEWNLDTAWVKLDGPFTQGSTGTLKPKGGPVVSFVIERLSPNTDFVDVSRLYGARLKFAHLVNERPDGGSDVTVTVSMTGPLSRLWRVILGRGLAASAQPDLDRLAAVAEGVTRAV